MSDAGPGRRPDDFKELGGRRWWHALRGAVREFREDNVTDWSAALTYYAVLALFPALIVLVALVGLVGQHPQTTNAILDVVSEVGPEGAADTSRDPRQPLNLSGGRRGGPSGS